MRRARRSLIQFAHEGSRSASDRLGYLRHIGVGRTHTGTHVTLLIQELNVTVINAATGEILRELTIDLNRDYQPAGTKK